MKYETILPYIEKGLVSENTHPEDPNVSIFNYTQECQFSRAWDDVTRQCRGLIMNTVTGEVLARPFEKFFNYEEHVANKWPIPDDEPEIYEKLDGSLGIAYVLNGKVWIATRGSFISDQAVWATEWMRRMHPDYKPKPGFTDLFEIIYPENRIVVSYDFSGLVYLTSILVAEGTDAGTDLPEFQRAKRIYNTDVAALKAMDTPNSEGFVIFYPKENVRMKIKFAEYVRLHKLITGVSEIAIWEHLSAGNDLKDLLEKVPDEFFKWVTDVQGRLWNSYNAIMDESQRVLNEVTKLETRKAQAEHITVACKKYSGVIFNLLDGQVHKARQLVWKMVRPRGRSSFKVDIDT